MLTVSMSYKENILREMKARRVSQSELARRIGITSQGVSQWFSDDNSPPRDRAPDIAKALDVSEAYLLYGKELLPPEPPATLPRPKNLPNATPDTEIIPPSRETLWRAIGTRMHNVRVARMRFDLPDAAANALGITPDDLITYETGMAGVPVETLIAFCGKFAVSPEYILEGNRSRLDTYLASNLP